MSDKAKQGRKNPDDQIREKRRFFNLSEITHSVGIPYNKLDKNMKCSLNSMSVDDINLLFDCISENCEQLRELMLDRKNEKRANV